MEELKKILIVCLLAAIAMLITAACTGCSEEQFDQANEIAATVETVATGAEAVMQSPAGNLVPQPFGGIVRLVIEGVLGLLAIWKAKESRIRGAVLRSVVQAVDSPADTKEAVKANLKAAGIETEGRAIIAEYKGTAK